MALVVFNQKGRGGQVHHRVQSRCDQRGAGLRTLLIDLDQQGNSTRYLLGAPAAGSAHGRELLRADAGLQLQPGTGDRFRPADAVRAPRPDGRERPSRRAAGQARVATRSTSCARRCGSWPRPTNASTSTRRRR